MLKSKNTWFDSDNLPWFIIFLGIVFRVVEYLHNRSLYIDEARDTVVGIIGRNFSDLLNPPPSLHMTTSLPGFIVVEKLVVELFGSSEYALRLFPLAAGILSLILFYYVAKKYINFKAIPWALALFAASGPLIYYSSSAKPYSIDVLIALIIYLMAIHIQSEGLTLSRAALFGIAGTVAVWFSSPTVFILAGVGTIMFVFSMFRKEWTKACGLLGVFLLWFLSFALCYLLFLKFLTNNGYFQNAFRGEEMFMPLPPLSVSDIKWYIERFFGTFKETAELTLAGLAAAVFIVGSITSFRTKKEKFLILVSPIFFALLASGLTLYPFRQRTVLFFIPSLILLIAEGAGYIREKTSQHASLIGITVCVMLLFHPVLSSVSNLIKPELHDEIKPVLNYVRGKWHEGDMIYLHYRAHPAFEYYKDRYGFNKSDYVVGTYAGYKYDYYTFSLDHLKAYTNDLDKLDGRKRVWIVFTATPFLGKGIDDKVFFTYYLSTIGAQLDSFKSAATAVYLYDLSEEAPSINNQEFNTPRELHWNF